MTYFWFAFAADEVGQYTRQCLHRRWRHSGLTMVCSLTHVRCCCHRPLLVATACQTKILHPPFLPGDSDAVWFILILLINIIYDVPPGLELHAVSHGLSDSTVLA